MMKNTPTNNASNLEGDVHGDGMTEILRLNFRIYKNEDPALYEKLLSVSHRDRARAARSLLRRGLMAPMGPASVEVKSEAAISLPKEGSSSNVECLIPHGNALTSTAFDDFDVTYFLKVS